MAEKITDTDDIKVGHIIKQGMQEFEVIEIQPEPDGFGPPFEATLEAQKELGDFGSEGQIEEIRKGQLLGGFEIIGHSEDE
jgi:hypothetical protein